MRRSSEHSDKAQWGEDERRHVQEVGDRRTQTGTDTEQRRHPPIASRPPEVFTYRTMRPLSPWLPSMNTTAQSPELTPTKTTDSQTWALCAIATCAYDSCFKPSPRATASPTKDAATEVSACRSHRIAAWRLLPPTSTRSYATVDPRLADRRSRREQNSFLSSPYQRLCG